MYIKVLDRNMISKYASKNNNIRKFKVGTKYTLPYPNNIEICSYGFHYCSNLKDAVYYCNNIDDRFFEIVPEGNIISGLNKSYCSEITLIREIPIEELLKLDIDGTWSYRIISKIDVNKIINNKGIFYKKISKYLPLIINHLINLIKDGKLIYYYHNIILKIIGLVKEIPSLRENIDFENFEDVITNNNIDANKYYRYIYTTTFNGLKIINTKKVVDSILNDHNPYLEIVYKFLDIKDIKKYGTKIVHYIINNDNNGKYCCDLITDYDKYSNIIDVPIEDLKKIMVGKVAKARFNIDL
jgi:hypothetical protein